ncbi:hypothetical protein STAL104432_28270 [Streptomyces albus]
MGAKPATVITWLSSPIPAAAVPTATTAVIRGRAVAAREPKARKSTTAAAASPMASAVFPLGGSVVPALSPPASTWSPSPAAFLAVSIT